MDPFTEQAAFEEFSWDRDANSWQNVGVPSDAAPPASAPPASHNMIDMSAWGDDAWDASAPAADAEKGGDDAAPHEELPEAVLAALRAEAPEPEAAPKPAGAYTVLTEDQLADAEALLERLPAALRAMAETRRAAGQSVTARAPVLLTARVPELPRVKVHGVLYYRFAEGPVGPSMRAFVRTVLLASAFALVVCGALLALDVLSIFSVDSVLFYIQVAVVFAAIPPLGAVILFRRPRFQDMTALIRLAFPSGKGGVTMAEAKKVSAETPGYDVFMAQTMARFRDTEEFSSTLAMPRLGRGVDVGPFIPSTGEAALSIPHALIKREHTKVEVRGMINVRARTSLPFGKHRISVLFKGGQRGSWEEHFAQENLSNVSLEWTQGNTALDFFQLSFTGGAHVDSVTGTPVLTPDGVNSWKSKTGAASFQVASSTTINVMFNGQMVAVCSGRRW